MNIPGKAMYCLAYSLQTKRPGENEREAESIGKIRFAGIIHTTEHHDTGKDSIGNVMGARIGCGRCCHHSYPKLSEKKNKSEDTFVPLNIFAIPLVSSDIFYKIMKYVSCEFD